MPLFVINKTHGRIIRRQVPGTTSRLVVTNPGGPFLEALGDAAEYFDCAPDVDIDGLAACIARAIESSSVLSDRARREEIAAPFTWAASAQLTSQVWREIASRPNS